MSLLEPAEIRYTAISAFGLLVFTTLLKWAGFGISAYQPTEPSVTNSTQVETRSFIEDLLVSTFFGTTGESNFLDLIMSPLQLVADFLLIWTSVWDVMGFGSIFIIVPMFIMLTIIGGVAVKLLMAVLP